MQEWKIVVAVFLIAIILIIIGDSKNDVIEIHDNGATMCLACVGLE